MGRTCTAGRTHLLRPGHASCMGHPCLRQRVGFEKEGDRASWVQTKLGRGGTCFPCFRARQCFKWSPAGRWFPWPAALPAAGWVPNVQGQGSNPGQTQVAGALLSL